jgi:hypothetical protein
LPWFSRASSSTTEDCASNQDPELCCPQAWLLGACSATVLPSWSPCLESKPQNSCWPKTWFLHACTRCHGSWSLCSSKWALGLLLPTGLVPLCLQQHYCTVLLEAHDGNQAPELPLLEGLAPPSSAVAPVPASRPKGICTR